VQEVICATCRSFGIANQHCVRGHCAARDDQLAVARPVEGEDAIGFEGCELDRLPTRYRLTPVLSTPSRLTMMCNARPSGDPYLLSVGKRVKTLDSIEVPFWLPAFKGNDRDLEWIVETAAVDTSNLLSVGRYRGSV